MVPKKICFVSPHAYPLLQKKSNHNFMGGAELQQVLLAHFLQKNGWDVSFVTLAWGNERSDECLDGIKIYKSYTREEGLHYLRFLYPRFFKTWKAMMRANADIYYQRGACSLTAIVSLFCKFRNKIFLFSGAHDTNFMLPSRDLPRLFDEKLYKWGLKKATYIFVQSKSQCEMLFNNYKRNGIVVKNIYPPKNITKDNKQVLWVGNIKRLKRPLMFIEIAKRFPEYNFIMIGGAKQGEDDLYHQILAESKFIPNLHFLGFKPLEETENYFERVSLFISTAEMEGFPNTFLQAWSRGIPVISFLDIDNIITENMLGVVVNDIEEVDVHLDRLLNLKPEDRIRIRNYVLRSHSPEGYVKAINGIISTEGDIVINDNKNIVED